MKHTLRKTNTSYRLTPELSGGAAVRLDEELDGCDAACSGDDVGARRTRSLSNRLPPKTASSESSGLLWRCAKSCCGDGRQASAKLGETHDTTNQHELPTNA